MDNNKKPPLQHEEGELKLTIKEAAVYINESPTIVRNWQKQLKSLLLTRKGENGYNYFDKESIEQLLLIKKLHRDQGYSMRQVEHYIATGGVSFKPQSEKEVDSSPTYKELLEKVNKLEERSAKQEEFNKVLLTKLEEQNKFYRESHESLIRTIERKEQQLLESLKPVDTAEQIAATTEPEEPKGLLKRFFKRGK